MRVGTKLSAVTVAGVVLVLGINSYQRIQRELALYSADMERDHRTLAHGLSLAAQVVADRSGIEPAVELLRGANERESRMEISWSVPQTSSTARAGANYSHVIERAAGKDEEWLVSRVPLRLRGSQGVLSMREPLAPERSYIETTARRNVLVTTEVAAFCMAVIVGAAFMFVSRPMRLLIAKLKRIGEGDLTQPLVLRQRDEIGELAAAINKMCEQLAHARALLEAETQKRIAAVEQMRHADRLSIVGQLASGVAHELGTPLNVVLAHARETCRNPNGPTVAADAGVIVEQAERMTAIIRQLLDLSRRHTPDKQPEDVRAIVNKTFSVLTPVANRHGIDLQIDKLEKPVIAAIDAAQIQQVLANLLMNAIQSQSRGGRVRVRVEEASNAPEVRIRIEDDGAGIPAQDREHIFEPFFTTKDPGEGTGLGLTVSYGIVSDHGGRIEVESEQGRGSAFTVCLPAPAR